MTSHMQQVAQGSNNASLQNEFDIGAGANAGSQNNAGESNADGSSENAALGANGSQMDYYKSVGALGNRS